MKFLVLLLLIFCLGASACQEAAIAPDDTAPTVSGTPLSYDLLAEHAWKQLTRSPGKFSLCRFTRDETRLDQLRVILSTGNGLSIQGVFRFTDDELSAAQRSGLFIMDGGLIEEPVTLRLLPKDQSLVIIDSMGQEQKLRRLDSLSRSR